jgi:hypothetical protein
MTTPERHLTALDLDRLLLDETDPGERTRIESHADACPACGARRAEHVDRAARFRGVVFPRTAPALEARRPAAAPGRLWLLGLAVPALGLVLAAGLGRLRDRGGPHAGPLAGGPELGVKGGPLLHVFARRGDRAPDGSGPVVRVADGTRLAAGDALRFVLDPTGLPYVLIVSVDGAGQVNIYFPFHGEVSAPVDGRTSVSVPGSIVLDEAPGPERLYVIYSERPIEARAVRHVLARTAAGGAPAIRSTVHLPIEGSVQATLLFEKEGNR